MIEMRADGKRDGRAAMFLRLGLAGLLVTAGLGAQIAEAGPGVALSVISTDAARVTGGDALLEVRGVEIAPTLTVDGQSSPTRFTRVGANWRGLVTDLSVGSHTLVATAGGPKAAVTVRNFPEAGPVFAGAQVQPWPCATAAAGLGEPRNAACEVDPVATFHYFSKTSQVFLPYVANVSDLDVATTTTDDGKIVPYVIRQEQGVLDRGIYSWAVLWDRDRPFNNFVGKVLLPFKGGCDPVYAQTQPVDVKSPNVATRNEEGTGNARYALSRGFAVATSSNFILGNQCNTTVAAETAMMLKEHIVETTSTPLRYTVGSGCSGGSIMQISIAAAYPGILDGLMPTCTFTDIQQVSQEAQDCNLVNRAFNQPGLDVLDVDARRAVMGYALPLACYGTYDGPTGFAQRWFDPDNGTFCKVASDQIFDASNNPTGVRCTIQDYNEASVGTRPDGHAKRFYDNVGVQYGLRALEAGAIDAEQFVDLNEAVGGYDINWNWTPSRSRADEPAIAYRTGWNASYHNLAMVPIINLHGFDVASGHFDIHSDSLKARLERDTGRHGNLVLWKGPEPTFTDSAALSSSFDVITSWLDRITSDISSRTLPEKVLANKPVEARNSCWVAGIQDTDFDSCRKAFPSFSDPRLVAGGPLADDVVACQLKPLDPTAYPYTFTSEQVARLQAIFAAGVCDYSKPGVGQQRTLAWQTY